MQPQKPTLLYVVAALGLGLAMWALLYNFLSLIGSFVSTEPVPMPFFGGQAIEIPAGTRYISGITSFVALLYTAMLVAASIGTFFLKPWARHLMNAYAAVALLNNAAYLIIYLITAMPMLQTMAASTAPQGAPPGAMFMGMLCGTLCFLPLLIGYPVLALVVYNLRSSKAAFAGTFPQPTYGNVQYAQQPYYPDPNQQQGGYYYPPQQSQQPPYPGYGAPPPPAYPTDANSPPPPPPDRQ